MKYTLIAALMNEQGDYHEVEVEVGRRHKWKPRFMGIAVGWKDATPEQMIEEAYEDAVRSTSERLPGTWTVMEMFDPKDLVGTTLEERYALLLRVIEHNREVEAAQHSN